MMQLGEMLSMSLADVRDLPASEITYWLAYMKMKDKPKEDEDISTADKFKMIMQR